MEKSYREIFNELPDPSREGQDAVNMAIYGTLSNMLNSINALSKRIDILDRSIALTDSMTLKSKEVEEIVLAILDKNV